MNSEIEKKGLALAYALWALSIVGICGVQRMYLGQSALGIAMLVTFGFCGVGQLLDLLLLPDALNQANRRLTFSSNGLDGAVPPIPKTAPVHHRPSVSSQMTQGDELDQLLEQAKQAVNRTDHIGEDS